ncbi:TssQ family T6SS-associated lipoprotein [Massilia sp. LXY-6]|uniref:TssQ family T6SS-associated lipoprotein n=1 Tax=Massilia sp. LXY-6 TaxID=3379823 RepID=UPI003EDF2A07
MMTKQRLHLLTLATAGALLLGGCAEFPIFDQKPARTPSHPKVSAPRTTPVERDTSPPREAAKPRDRDRSDGPGVPDTAKETSGLREGIRLYNEGDFNGAIRRLSQRDVNNGPMATRLEALKYLAFSYCVTSRPAPCRQAFDRALRLDPSFDLAPGEHGHPLWGPVFTKAKQAAASR